MLLSTKQKSRNEVTLVVPSFVDVNIPPSFDHDTPCLVFGLRLIGVRDLKSVIVDNGWNRDRQEPKVSLARGKATLERLVEWFLN
jgi:FMN-dependent NADH-azoreductase